MEKKGTARKKAKPAGQTRCSCNSCACDIPYEPQLRGMAQKAADGSYSPYSKIRVGAAVLTDKGMFSGANVENASYCLTVCAERSAVFRAVNSGASRVKAVAVHSPDAMPHPCGACLQVIAEFAGPETPVFVSGGGVSETHELGELLPRPFRAGKK